MKLTALAAGVLYLIGIVVANVLTSHFHQIPVGFGLVATAGTLAAGAVLVTRNALQEAAGRRWVYLLILVGALWSLAFGSGRIALASGATFLVAESLDTTVYSGLRAKGWRRAALAGTWVGAAVDTVLFLWLAGFPITGQSVGGQLLVKGIWALIVYLVVGEAVSRAVSRQRLVGESA